MSAPPGAPPPVVTSARVAQHRRCAKCQGRYAESSAFCPTDGTALELAPGSLDDRSGEIVGERYRLMKLLGQGGMGQVYEAQHVALGKRIAVKLLRREVVAARPEILSRFKQEARAASSIGHPSIVAITDFATTPDGGVYLAMELLRGQSLADFLAEHAAPAAPLPLEDGLRILVEAARGLAAAHAASIVHRDIKPENLFLAAHKSGIPRLKILDFGIAKMSSESQPHLTQTGAVFGTPLYMSPEQALGRPVDARSDIYSLAVIAYQIFSGDVPFRAESLLGVLNQHVQAPPRPLLESAAGRITPAMAAVVERALAKDPDARFQTMDAFATALVEAARGESTAAVPTMNAAAARPKRAWLPAVLAAVVLVLGGLAIARLLHRRAPRQVDSTAAVAATAATAATVTTQAPAATSVTRPVAKKEAKRHVASTEHTTAAPEPRAGALVSRKVASGQQADFSAELRTGRCYAIVARGAHGISAIHISLWDPTNRHVADSTQRSANPTLDYCAEIFGLHRILATPEGSGEFTVGVYPR